MGWIVALLVWGGWLSLYDAACKRLPLLWTLPLAVATLMLAIVHVPGEDIDPGALVGGVLWAAKLAFLPELLHALARMRGKRSNAVVGGADIWVGWSFGILAWSVHPMALIVAWLIAGLVPLAISAASRGVAGKTLAHVPGMWIGTIVGMLLWFTRT